MNIYNIIANRRTFLSYQKIIVMKKYFLSLVASILPFFLLAQTQTWHKGEKVIKAGAGIVNFVNASKNKNNYGLSLEFLKRYTERFSYGGIYAFVRNNSIKRLEDIGFSGDNAEELTNHSIGIKGDYAFIAHKNFRLSAALSAGIFIANQATWTYTSNNDKIIDGKPSYKKDRYYHNLSTGMFGMAQLSAIQYLNKNYFIGFDVNGHIPVIDGTPSSGGIVYLLDPHYFSGAITIGKTF